MKTEKSKKDIEKEFKSAQKPKKTKVKKVVLKADEQTTIMSHEDLSMHNQLKSSYTFEVEKNNTWRKSKSSFIIPIFIGAALVSAPIYFAIEATLQDPSETPIEKVWAKYDQLFVDSIKPFNPTSDFNGQPIQNTQFYSKIIEINNLLKAQGITPGMDESSLNERINSMVLSPIWPSSLTKIALDELRNLIYYRFDFDEIKNDGNIDYDSAELIVSFKLSPNPLINNYVITESKSYGINNDSKFWNPDDNIITFGAGLDNTIYDLFNIYIYDFIQSVSVVDGLITPPPTQDQLTEMYNKVERSALSDQDYFGGIFNAIKLMGQSSTGWICTPIEAYRNAFFTNTAHGSKLNVHALTSYFHTSSVTNGSELFWWITEENIDAIHLSDIPQFVGTSYDEQALFKYTLKNNELPKELPLEERWNTYGRNISPLSMYEIDDKLDDYDELIKFALNGGVIND